MRKPVGADLHMAIDREKGIIECYYCRMEATRFYVRKPGIKVIIKYIGTCDNHKVVNTDYEELTPEESEVLRVMIL